MSLEAFHHTDFSALPTHNVEASMYALRLLLMNNVGNTLYEALLYSPSFPLYIFITHHS